MPIKHVADFLNQSNGRVEERSAEQRRDALEHMTYSWLATKVSEAEEAALRLGFTPLIRLGAQGNDSAITEVEIKLGVSLPPSYRQFLRLYDGAFVGLELTTSSLCLPSGVKIYFVTEMLTTTAAYRSSFTENTTRCF